MRLAVVLLAASSAVASAQPEPCNVTISLAPPEVRAEIEQWVRAEPRCTRQLEVRVVATEDGGLYLTTRDQEGRVRERVVPDAQSAAVLVVSWMADDSLGPAYPDPTPTPTPPLRATRTVGGDDDESPFVPPGLTGGHTRFKDTGRRFLSLGAIGSSPEHAGIRGEVDLLGGSQLLGGVRWLVGVAGGWREDGGQARLIVGATYSIGRVSVRAQLGIGADLVEHHHAHDRMMTTMMMDGDMDDHVEPRVEAGVLGRIAIDHNWAAIGGPIVGAPIGDGRPELELFLGVQHGL